MDHVTEETLDHGRYTILKLPREIADCLATNIEARATYMEAVGVKCTTPEGKHDMAERVTELRRLARDYREAAT